MKRALLAFTTLIVSTSVYAVEPSAGMGKGLYTQPGSNSCMYCHGISGEGGSVKNAAKLDMPKTWKIYKILGGDAAFAKDKAGFLQKMHDATVHLITKSAVAHNVTFKAQNPWFDVSKGGGPYDAQMLGLTSGPSQAWLKKFADKGVTKEIAAESAYLFVQSLDKQAVFK